MDECNHEWVAHRFMGACEQCSHCGEMRDSEADQMTHNAPAKAVELLPCPFCGSSEGLEIHEGSTFRWRIGYCLGCGASSGEERINTLCDDRDLAESQVLDAIYSAWNRRAAPPHRRRDEVMAMESFVEFCADINHGYSFTDWSTFYRLRNDAIDELELRRASAPPQHDGKCLRCGKWRITRDLRDHKCECVEKNLREQIDRLVTYGINDAETIRSLRAASPPSEGAVTEAIDAKRYRWLKNNWERAGRFLNSDDLNACVDWHLAALEAAERARPGADSTSS